LKITVLWFDAMQIGDWWLVTGVSEELAASDFGIVKEEMLPL
jgi:hypothetical protein